MDKKDLTIFEYKLPVVIEKDTDGFIAKCPKWEACFAEGDTIEEVISEISQVATSLIDLYKEEKLTIPLQLKETTKQKSSFSFNFPLIISGNHA